MMAWPPLLIRIAMTASTPARILTVALLLLSIAPWASLYALMVSLNVNGSFLSPQGDQMSLASVLQDPNATLDELYRALFRESLTKGMNLNNIHHWTIVLPWGISLTLGIVIPFLLSLCACIRQDHPWRLSRTYRDEKRLVRLTLESNHYRMTLADDHKENDERWNVNGNSSFEGTCAICLTQYATGDQIIFSSNPKCQHVFHGDCILSWLVKRRQCPCCRQVFFPKKE